MKKIVRFLFSRCVIVSFLVLAQLTIFFLFLFYLSQGFLYLYIALYVISILVAFFIISKDETPAYKVPWLVVTLGVPILGGLMYLMFSNNLSSRANRKRFDNVRKQVDKYLEQDTKVINKLKEENPALGNQASYLSNFASASVYNNSKSKYFDSGEKMYKAMIEKFKEAKQYIFLEYFIIQKGIMWNGILEILKDKVKEGIEVRVIYDDIGSINTLSAKYYKELQSYGIKCIAFNKYKPMVDAIFNNRDHRKIAIIDGLFAFTGGINLADEYINVKERFGYWKDTGIMIEGEAVEAFVALFLEVWGAYEPNNDDLTKYFLGCVSSFQAKGYVQPFGDGPRPIYDEYIGESVYLNIINNAKNYLYISTPYYVVDYRITNAIKLAAKRGVDVRIILPGIPDKRSIFWITQSSYKTLLDSGVRIYEYTPGFIHAKNFISDNEVGVVGTINLDYRSLCHHFECGVVLYETSSLTCIKKDFIQTLTDSKEIYKAPKVNIFKKIYIIILQLFSPLL